MNNILCKNRLNIITINPKADFDASLTGVEIILRRAYNCFCSARADTYRFLCWSFRTVTATAGNGGVPGEFNNGDRIKVEVADACTFTDKLQCLLTF